MSNFIAEYVKKGNNNYMIIKADREYMTRKINTCMKGRHVDIYRCFECWGRGHASTLPMASKGRGRGATP